MFICLRLKLLLQTNLYIYLPVFYELICCTFSYIAIVMPKVNEGSKVLDDLLSEEQYQDYLLHSDTGI